MIKDDIISIAREAGCLGPGLGGDPDGLWEPSGEENVTELMFRFAELLEAKVRADDRKLLEQALKALEVLTDTYDDNAVGIEIDAIVALRKRLAQPEQKPVDIGTEWTSCVKLPVTVHVRQQRPGETHVSTREGITPVKPDDLIMRGVSGEEYPIGREIFERTYRLGEAQTKPEQDPVAYVIRTLSGKSISDEIAPTRWSTFESKIEKLRADPWVQNGIAEIIPLYTAPQKREWQGLTDEDVRDLWSWSMTAEAERTANTQQHAFALAVAAKLKEKNT